MTRNEVLELAIEAELWNRSDEPDDCNGLGDLALSLVEFAKLVAEKEREPCAWTEDAGDYYSTSCGEAFVFNDGSPATNKAYFCHHCGGRIVVKKEGGEE